MTKNQRVIIPNFFGAEEPLLSSQIGWSEQEKREAKSSVSKKIFNYFIEDCGRNMMFYYIKDGNFYGIHAEICPTPVFRFKKVPAEYIYDELGDQDTHDYQSGDILCWVDKGHDIWDVVTIDGKSLEEVLQDSYIVNIS